MNERPKEIVMRQRTDFTPLKKPLIVAALAVLTIALAFARMEGLAGWSLFVTLIYALFAD